MEITKELIAILLAYITGNALAKLTTLGNKEWYINYTRSLNPSSIRSRVLEFKLLHCVYCQFFWYSMLILFTYKHLEVIDASNISIVALSLALFLFNKNNEKNHVYEQF